MIRSAWDRSLFIIIMMLVLFGVVMVYSTSGVIAAARYEAHTYYLMRQGLWFLVAAAVFLVLANVPYAKWNHQVIAGALLLSASGLLVAALFSPKVFGASRWIQLRGFSFQPSEFAKWALIVALASLLARRESELDGPKPYVVGSVIIAVLGTLIALQPDFGTTVLLAAVGGVVMFAAGMPWKYVFGLGAMAVVVLGVVMVAQPYRLERLAAFRNPDDITLKGGFQVRQSLLAVGSGGLFGKGLGGSEQKQFFLPEPHTDFTFSIIGEEFGFAGSVAVLAAFLAVALLGIRAAYRAPDLFGRLLAVGCTVSIVLQAMLHIGVTLQLLPTKGLPLPFLSYGGSSLVANCAAAGLLLNVSSSTES